jgi:hypothetical protein
MPPGSVTIWLPSTNWSEASRHSGSNRKVDLVVVLYHVSRISNDPKMQESLAYSSLHSLTG